MKEMIEGKDGDCLPIPGAESLVGAYNHDNDRRKNGLNDSSDQSRSRALAAHVSK